MASRTQIRLGQITGSFGNRQGGIIDSQPASSAANLAAYNAVSGSMVGIMSDIASGLLRIHGGSTFAGGGVSTLKDINGDDRITYVQGAKTLIVGEGSGADSIDINAGGGFDLDAAGVFTADAVGASNLTTNGALTVSGSTGLNIHSHGGEVDVTSTQGAVDINAGAAVTITAGAESEFNTTAGALILDGKTGITIQENNATIIAINDDRDITTTNTRQVHLDASGVVNINSSAGVLSLGNDDVDQNINIGTDGDRTIVIGKSGGSTTTQIHSDGGNLALDAGSNSVAVTGGLTVSGNTTMTGNLTVLGAATEISSSNTTIKDALIVLNSSSFGDGTPISQDAGIIFAQPDVSRALFVDQSDSLVMKFAKTYSSGSATSVDIFHGLADVALKKLLFHDNGGEHITGDGSKMTVTSAGAIELSAGSDVVIPKNIGITFDDNGSEKIESNDTDLTITSGAKIKLTATSDVEIPDSIGLLFGAANRAIESDGNNLNVTATSGFLGINFGNNEGVVYKENNVQFGKLTNESGNALTLSASLGPITLSSNTGVFNLHEFGNLGGTITSELEKSELIISGAQGNALILAAGADSIKLSVEENELFTIKSDTSKSILSSSAGRQLVLESNTGKVAFQDPLGSPGQKFEIDTVTEDSITRLLVDEGLLMKLDGSLGSFKTTVSGSLIVDGGAAAGSIAFLETTPNGTGRVILQGPAAVNSNDTVTLTLPNNDGNANDALISDGSGNLSFSAIGASAARKGVFLVGASGVSAGGNFDINSGEDLGSDAITLGGVDATQGRVLDVFVNGQLMASGSAAQRAGGTCDFEIKSTTRLLFSFDLELDDVVTVIKRG